MTDPVGQSLNGLGALPSPYGPTLRGAHYPLPSVATKIKRLICGLDRAEGSRSWIKSKQNHDQTKILSRSGSERNIGQK